MEKKNNDYFATFFLTNSRRDIYRRREKYRRGTFRRNFRALKKTFSTFSFRIIYFRMLRIRILKIIRKNFLGVLILSFKKRVTKICRFFLSAVAFAPIDLKQ
jgi:hypothetical protein